MGDSGDGDGSRVGTWMVCPNGHGHQIDDVTDTPQFYCTVCYRRCEVRRADHETIEPNRGAGGSADLGRYT
jgi:hypothetical protein